MAPSRERQHSNEDDDREEEPVVSHSSNPELPIYAYVPDFLKQVVFPCTQDFCQSPLFHKKLVAQLMAEGFLPIATEGILLPKLHRRRCVIHLPDDLRVSKSVRKKSKRFSLSVNRDFNAVIRGCHEQHAPNCWLVPPLVKAFRELNQSGSTDAILVSQGQKCPVRMYSIEIWNEEGTLVGGELGYTVGSIYTSLTGFCNQSNAGSVQLLALGRLLSQNSFTMWDLGMDMNYKRELGSQLMPRSEYVQEVRRVRVMNGHVVLPTGEETVNCKEIIDRALPQTPANAARRTASAHPVHSSPVPDEDNVPHKKARSGSSPESVEDIKAG